MKPFFGLEETVLKPSVPTLGSPRMGELLMTLFVALLIGVSAAVFLAHAFDAYHAG